MDRTRTLVALLSKLGSIDLSEFDKRLIFQKRVYFLKVFGIDPGYNFTYYLRGPFSFELMREQIPVGYMSDFDIEFKDAELEKRFKDYLEFINPVKDDARKLELLASLQFLKIANPGMEKDELFGKVMSKFRNMNSVETFSLDECNWAWNYLAEWEEYTGVPD